MNYNLWYDGQAPDLYLNFHPHDPLTSNTKGVGVKGTREQL